MAGQIIIQKAQFIVLLRFKKIFTAVLLVLLLISSSSAENITYQHVRNATAKINYSGSVFLVDPFLAKKGAYPGFEGTPNSEKRIPLIDMAEPAEEVIKGVDAVILTHTHLDHWDESAQKLLPKDIPFFVQNAGDARIIREQGFTNVMVVGINTLFKNVRISRTGGQHGPDEMYSIPAIAEFAGDAMGFILQAEGFPTLYTVSDTIWHDYVDDALERYKPEIIIMNTGYAMINGFKGSLIMGTDDILKMHNTMTDAKIIAVHMDAVNHTTISSDQVREFVKDKALSDRVYIPREGEILNF
ncbi:MAG: MBL fold metallo-hydrolase [Synergistaceae bacterium]|nr:MBL fold metallo-hydrolase [Synergistaceae bacterium]